MSGMPPSRERLRIVWTGRRGRGGDKPNPLAGFGGVGYGVCIGGQGADYRRGRTISALAGSANSKKTGRAKVPGGQKMRFIPGRFALRKKKKIDFAGKSIFF